ncbi:hypothetical protein D3C73_1031230 [compost metagenome]
MNVLQPRTFHRERAVSRPHAEQKLMIRNLSAICSFHLLTVRIDMSDPGRSVNSDTVVLVPFFLFDQNLLTVQIGEQPLGQLNPVIRKMRLLPKDGDLRIRIRLPITNRLGGMNGGHPAAYNHIMFGHEHSPPLVSAEQQIRNKFRSIFNFLHLIGILR